jgi:hypothetical protein
VGWLSSNGVELHDWIWLHTSVNLEMDMIFGFFFFGIMSLMLFICLLDLSCAINC